MFDILSIGDSTIDVFMEVDVSDAEKVCDKNDQDCKICFSYASKIPAKNLTRVAGVGNAANNAVGSARLGLKTAIYTVLGSDHDSTESKEVFEKEGVDTSFVVMESGKRSNFSTVINYSGELGIIE
jgi:sugar/nucleoside kinase (ribokinase family)